LLLESKAKYETGVPVKGSNTFPFLIIVVSSVVTSKAFFGVLAVPLPMENKVLSSVELL
jgi:hypothetical protein